MKNVIAVMLFVVVFANLTGCASAPQPTKYNLSETEQQQIKNGNLIKFGDKQTLHQFLQSTPVKLDKTNLTKGVFVCATPTSEGDVCYPHLSNTVASYLAKNGVKISSEASNANEILYFSLGFDYAPADDAVNKALMEDLDNSIAIGKGVVLDKISLRDKSDDGRKSLLINVGTALLAAKAGGATSMQTSNGVSLAAQSGGNPAQQGQPHQIMNILLCAADQQGKKSSCFGRGEYHTYSYYGPKSVEATFPTLFEQAMKETVADIVMN